ncbi:uncharacterized protein LOC120396365 isoform X2 [Mauremys reevesii]|uniref:uncharacterized protein LOC120396365 isoform X2 n=1 Tax=Mauremys reevesii TaxID=260615 RepID=UPI00193F56ED|nr:uncharacterized protein LOC120396365 isoform X2 [Mauremys reevesii]
MCKDPGLYCPQEASATFTALAAVDLLSLGPGEEPSCESPGPDLHVLSPQSHHRATVHTKTGAVATVLSKTQKDDSCRESPAHVAMGHGDPPKAGPEKHPVAPSSQPPGQPGGRTHGLHCIVGRVPRQPPADGEGSRGHAEAALKAMRKQREDSNTHIRGRGLHGLRNAVTEFPHKVRKKRDQILGRFVCAMCECCAPHAVVDAMEGLCWMLRDPNASLKAHVAVLLALQASTFFEDENSGLRRASMELFGNLTKFVCKKSSLFRAEVKERMGMLLIHLQDGDPQVAQLQDCLERLSKKAALRAAAAQQLIDISDKGAAASR